MDKKLLLQGLKNVTVGMFFYDRYGRLTLSRFVPLLGHTVHDNGAHLPIERVQQVLLCVLWGYEDVAWL